MKTKAAGKEAWQEAMEAFEQEEHVQEERNRSNGQVIRSMMRRSAIFLKVGVPAQGNRRYAL